MVKGLVAGPELQLKSDLAEIGGVVRAASPQALNHTHFNVEPVVGGRGGKRQRLVAAWSGRGIGVYGRMGEGVGPGGGGGWLGWIKGCQQRIGSRKMRSTIASVGVGVQAAVYPGGAQGSCCTGVEGEGGIQPGLRCLLSTPVSPPSTPVVHCCKELWVLLGEKLAAYCLVRLHHQTH